MTKVTKTKKLLAAVLCLALLFSLAMCSRSCVSSKTSHSEEQEKERISQAVRASMDPMVGSSGTGIIAYEITDVQISDASAIATVKFTYLDEGDVIRKGSEEYIKSLKAGETADKKLEDYVEEAKKTLTPKETEKTVKLSAKLENDNWVFDVPSDITDAVDGCKELATKEMESKIKEAEAAIAKQGNQDAKDEKDGTSQTEQTPADQTQQPASDPQPQTQQTDQPQEQQPADPPKEDPKQDDEAAKRAEEEAARRAAEEEAARKAAEEEAARKAAEEEAKKKKEEEALHVHTHQWEDIVEIRHHEEQKELQPVEIEPAYDEEIWSDTAKAICKVCGAYFDTGDEVIDHIVIEHDGMGSYTADNVLLDVIHHEAVIEQQWVVTQEAYDEEVKTGQQKCSICGAIK